MRKRAAPNWVRRVSWERRLHFIPLLGGDVPVEYGDGRVFVGIQDQIAQIQGQHAKQVPADKSQIQDKQICFMAVH